MIAIRTQFLIARFSSFKSLFFLLFSSSNIKAKDDELE
jgi:hypothetical protein